MKRRAFVSSSFAAAMSATIPVSWLPARDRLARQDGDVVAVTGDGREITLPGSSIMELDSLMRGGVLLAQDDGYDEARRVLNPSFDKYPALIAQVTGTADVRLAVDFAREHSLLLAVKCGGHSASGKSTCDRGMMIDLSRFRNVRVDPAARRAWVTGGSLLGRLDHEAMSQGLVTPMGTVSHTGVGGLVTGGGFGRVARKFGLAIDNLTAVDVVTADGQFRRANREVHPDLFWGVRGGGGNFGIVTSFEFQLHPMQRRVVGGLMMFPIARARDVLQLYADYGPEAPDELALDFGLLLPPGGAPGVAGFAVCYCGAQEEADRALAPVRQLGTPVMDNVQPIEYVDLQRSGDIDDPRARASYLKSGFIPAVSADLITAIVDGIEAHPSRSTSMFVQQSGGAIGRVANDATAFPYRDAFGNLGLGVDWAFGDDPSEHVAWIKQAWTSIEPFTQGFYVNDGDPDAYAPTAVTSNYSSNYPRLVEVKNVYDPTNLFRLNANVEPTVTKG
jgi:FAD/FMN-containing dehydrogenase